MSCILVCLRLLCCVSSRPRHTRLAAEFGEDDIVAADAVELNQDAEDTSYTLSSVEESYMVKLKGNSSQYPTVGQYNVLFYAL